jgi:FkbM family methyltransferase
MPITILYGIKGNSKDVSEICFKQLTHNNIMTIPVGDDNRSRFFKDHLIGTVKKIFLIIDDKEFEYDLYNLVSVNLQDSTIQIDNCDKIRSIHNKLKIKYGSLQQELPEQKMAAQYLIGNEKVLEIGSNIGRNSLVIASIVNNENFVSLESDANSAKKLQENRDLNNFTFHIENSALSKRKLIQKGWNTKPSDILEEGYKWVNTISFEELQRKYQIEFDTLILDCEGAFYYILIDMPEILNTIQLIIMENDYRNIAHKNYIDSVLKKSNFYVDYTEGCGWGCCSNNFYEVWKKSVDSNNF